MIRAHIITDGSPEAHGVVVSAGAADISEGAALQAAIDALAAHGNEYGDPPAAAQAAEKLTSMSYVQVGAFRWTPMRDEDGYQGKQLSHAEPGSNGSWLGIFWSYPW